MVIRRIKPSMVAGRVAKILFFKCPHRKKSNGVKSVLRGCHSTMETCLPLKNLCKNSMVFLMYGHELRPIESKCIAHLCSLMGMKIMLNNEDTLRFRQHCKNFAWNFFQAYDNKIVIKSQRQHKIRSGLWHLLPNTCKLRSEWGNVHRPTVLARCARIFPGLPVIWYILYYGICVPSSQLVDENSFYSQVA